MVENDREGDMVERGEDGWHSRPASVRGSRPAVGRVQGYSKVQTENIRE